MAAAASSQYGGKMTAVLPPQYMGQEFLGGPSGEAHYQQYLKLQKNKRKVEQIDESLDGDRAIKAGKTLQTILVKPSLNTIEQEYLFDTVDDFYYEYVKPDKILSRVSGDDPEDEWILHFIMNAVGFYVTNPSYWRLELVSQFEWYAVDTPSTLYPFKSWNEVDSNKASVHLKPALNAERYMLEETRVVVGDTKRNVNATSPYLTRLSTLIMYMLKLSWQEKKNLELQRLTYNRPGLLCGKGRDYIGSHRRNNALKEVQQLVLKTEWDSGQAERDFDQDALDKNKKARAIKFLCQPLPGPFPMLNRMIPATFNPEIVIKLNKNYRQWMIVRPGSLKGYEENAAKAKEDPKASISSAEKTIGVKWTVDLAKTALRIPYLKPKPLDFQKNRNVLFCQPDY